jgi:hypothetical protein
MEPPETRYEIAGEGLPEPAFAASPTSGLRPLSALSNAREGFVPEDMT